MVQRLVIHAGAPKTATTFIQRGLHSNRALLAAHGVYLPKTGRLEYEPNAVCHHHLGWELIRPGAYEGSKQGWAALGRELERVKAPVVLLSSEVFSRVASKRGGADQLVEAARAICPDVTIVYFVRNQLSLINSLYGQRVKSLRMVETFDQHARTYRGRRLFDYNTLLMPWHENPRVTLTALPFSGERDGDPLVNLLTAGGIELPGGTTLVHAKDEVNSSLGPVGLEAARLLAAFLFGSFERFDPEEPAAKRLYRHSSSRARANGWCNESYWGWTPRSAADTAEHFAGANDLFSQAVWGGDWPLDMPLDRPSTAVRLLDLDPPTTERVHRYVFGLAERFAALRGEMAAA